MSQYSDEDYLFVNNNNKIIQLNWLKQQVYFLTALEPRSARLRGQHVRFLVRPRSLACGGCLLSLSHLLFPLCMCISGVSSSSHKETNCIGLGPHPYDLTNFNYPFKGSFSKYSNTGG